MAGEGNRIINLVKYAEAFGIDVNVGKNKAYGNKGLFKVKGSGCKIDISKALSDEEKVSVLIHEITHYIHHKYDKTLKSLDFIFKNFDGDYEEALIDLTVDSVPKSFASKLFNEKDLLNTEIKKISNSIKSVYPKIKLSDKNNALENEISRYEFKYLLKHDAVRIYGIFSNKIFSIKNIENDFPNIKQVYVNYLKLKSVKRKLNRINSKITRLNRYYNSPSELLARSFEYYILNPEVMSIKALSIKNYYDKVIRENLIPELTQLVHI